MVTVTVNEPLVERPSTFKAEAKIENVIRDNNTVKATGKVLLYFAKDTSQLPIYGDVIVIKKKLQPIQNTGNPGCFDYKRFSCFKQIFHSVYLHKADWVLLRNKNADPFRRFIFNTRHKILDVLKSAMGSHADELAIAEALLIGYTQDLDKDLVQAYSNTGVVHIIAISGLHLGLIYVMLVRLFNSLPFIKRSGLIKAVLILSCLWLFALLTGGSASVLRSAVMFSCIVIGENFQKRSSIYNSLAASAFILLSYNPFYLWDVGFQLSYLAVLGIVLFQKPFTKIFYIKNKLINHLWQLTCVSLSAQVFTFPVCIYYFHQFPNTFLFTNLLMVPLSSLILFVEIILVVLSWIPILAGYIGYVVYWLVWLMNTIILWFNDLPYSVWEGIPSTVFSTILLYGFIIFCSIWLMYKYKASFQVALVILFGYTFTNGYEKWRTAGRQKLVIYNIPQHQAIDFIYSNSFMFAGDSTVHAEGGLWNYHLKPARFALRLDKATNHIPGLHQKNKFFRYNGLKFLLLDSQVVFVPLKKKIILDYIILSKNTAVSLQQLLQTFECKQFIIDASNSLWKIGKWKKDLERLHLPFYSVPEKGAFIIEI
jgi:competence protein ComEC